VAKRKRQVPFTKYCVRNYLNSEIELWEGIANAAEVTGDETRIVEASAVINALLCVKIALFGEPSSISHTI